MILELEAVISGATKIMCLEEREPGTPSDGCNADRATDRAVAAWSNRRSD